MRLLVATAGTTLCATWFIGWLNGVIALITPSSGSRWVCTRRLRPCGVMSQEKVWPSSLRQAWAPNISTSATRPASYTVSFIDRPDSAEISAAIAALRSRTSAAARFRMLLRSKRDSRAR